MFRKTFRFLPRPLGFPSGKTHIFRHISFWVGYRTLQLRSSRKKLRISTVAFVLASGAPSVRSMKHVGLKVPQKPYRRADLLHSSVITLRVVGASEITNCSFPSLGSTREAESFSPRPLQPAFATPATKAQADDVLVSSIGTPLANR